MKNLLKMQQELTSAIDPIRARSVNLNDILDAIIAETIEVKEELPYEENYKTWKKKEFNEAALKEESIDILFFLLELYNKIGMNAEEVEEIYTKKYNKNLERIKSNWNK